MSLVSRSATPRVATGALAVAAERFRLLALRVMSVGASLTLTTVTVEAMASTVVSCPPLAVPPVSRRLVRVTTRFEVLGDSLVLR